MRWLTPRIGTISPPPNSIGAGKRCSRTPIQAACRSTKLRAPTSEPRGGMVSTTSRVAARTRKVKPRRADPLQRDLKGFARMRNLNKGEIGCSGCVLGAAAMRAILAAAKAELPLNQWLKSGWKSHLFSPCENVLFCSATQRGERARADKKAKGQRVDRRDRGVEIEDPRHDLVAEARAVEDAVMADFSCR